MEPSGTLQTVFGFGSRLDWWPTVFEEAFPPSVLCSACGLIGSMSGLLPCDHVLCGQCYHKCDDGGNSECPLDRRAHRKEDVIWSTYTRENLLCYKIRCWNRENGCSAVGSASDILAHFSDDCQYHVVTCQRCHRTVAQKEVIDHLVSGNCGQEQAQASLTLEGVGAASLLKSLQSLDQKLTESTRLNLDAIKDIHKKQTSLERNLGQLESRMGNMCSENTAKLLTAFSSIGTVITASNVASVNDKETIKAWEELQESANRRSGTEELLQMIKELGDKFSVVMAASKAILEKKLSNSEALEWTVGGWSKLKDVRSRGERAISWAENPGFFYGYYILPGVEIVYIEGTLSLRLVFKICQGLYDQLLSWPFEKEIYFKVLHPSERGSIECKTVCTKNLEEGLRMPRTVQRQVLIARKGIPIQTLETNGYSINDKIRIRFEVLP